MKRNIIHTLWAAALLLTACTQEELPLPGADNAAPLAITVTDGGYAPTASPGDMQKATATRATENGYRTDFTAGDQCGLYIVRNGAVVCENIKLTAAEGTEGGLVWQPDAGVTLAGGLSGESYFLYYPYQENMTDKVTASATSDEEFFAPLISGWQPEADQSDYAAGYTASDLMTAKGTASKADGKLSLSFAMTHRMALAVIEMPETVYKFTDTSIPDYTVLTAADFTAEANPCCNSDGTYRYIVNPAAQPVSLTGSYDNGKKEFTVTPNGIVTGNYKTYKVDGAKTDEKSHDLQVGDYLLADGNLVGKDETLTTGQQADVIAIVFHAGHHEKDGSDYANTGIGQQKCHGYAVALTDATSSHCMWGVYWTELGCYPTNESGNQQNNYSNPDIDWSGYSYTQTIITAAGGKENLNATEQSGYPATYYAVVDYENNKAQAPANSSGWFLPSIGQMCNVYQNRTSLFDGKTGVSVLQSGRYWSSSESYYVSPAYDALCVSVRNGSVDYLNKHSRLSYVRPVLAF